MFEFSKMIREIECEISNDYLPGAIKWVDNNYESAWSNAIERFDSALKSMSYQGDYSFLKREGEIYKNTVLELIKKYKQEKQTKEVQMFLQSIINISSNLKGIN